MQVKITTTVEVTNEVGGHVVTVSRTRVKDVGGNPLFFIREVMPVARENTAEAITLAADGADDARTKDN